MVCLQQDNNSGCVSSDTILAHIDHRTDLNRHGCAQNSGCKQHAMLSAHNDPARDLATLRSTARRHSAPDPPRRCSAGGCLGRSLRCWHAPASQCGSGLHMVASHTCGRPTKRPADVLYRVKLTQACRSRQGQSLAGNSKHEEVSAERIRKPVL